MKAPDITLPELIARVASFLPPNDIAASLRLACKAFAAQFCDTVHHLTIHLSQPCRPEVFAAHWSRPEAYSGLTDEQRRKLLCLVVRSGCLRNIEVALARARADWAEPLTADVEAAAAKSGSLEVVAWLRDRHGASFRGPRTLLDAAAAGSVPLCAYLLDVACCPWHPLAPCLAASEGHAELLGYLLTRRPAVGGGSAVGGGAAVDGWLAADAMYGLRLPDVRALMAGGHGGGGGPGGCGSGAADGGGNDGGGSRSGVAERVGSKGPAAAEAAAAAAAAAAADGAAADNGLRAALTVALVDIFESAASSPTCDWQQKPETPTCGTRPYAAGGDDTAAAAAAAAAARRLDAAALRSRPLPTVATELLAKRPGDWRQRLEWLRGDRSPYGSSSGSGGGSGSRSGGMQDPQPALLQALERRRRYTIDHEAVAMAAAGGGRVEQLAFALEEGRRQAAARLRQLRARRQRALAAVWGGPAATAAADVEAWDGARAWAEVGQAGPGNAPGQAAGANDDAAELEQRERQLAALAAGGVAPLSPAAALEAGYCAAAAGHVGVLQLLRESGCELPAPLLLHAAAEGARDGVLRWLVGGHAAAAVQEGREAELDGQAGATAAAAMLVEEAEGGSGAGAGAGGLLEGGAAAVRALRPEALARAARHGQVRLMAWLVDGCGLPLTPEALDAAAGSGCEAAVAWLVGRGCPVTPGRPYVQAALRGDLRTLSALHRLAVPWNLNTFARCVWSGWGAAERAGDRHGGAGSGGGAPLRALEWLLSARCPVHWSSAERAAEMRGTDDAGRVAAWVAARRKQAAAAAAAPAPAGPAGRSGAGWRRPMLLE
ncbi:hypothetical protein HXX76_004511 [Chlamydomonas incerta]|uniref:Uncharacterized protein n=1 Tax=Chlamydomonas incerta TaxID=51695 RepID=A0A835TF05_CHLIN|nr:hypothetical protein HXX76_004511 [Chlamydomonas incerta]|eukprot:KAG2439144.1 hypothetical protein HXX76_004511 [Chlamydomonas incerta]